MELTPGEPTTETDTGPTIEALRASLAETVDRRIREAVSAREASGIEEIWQEDADQYEGIDELSAPTKRLKDGAQAPNNRAQDGRSRVYLNITKGKTEAAVARVTEMLVPSDDKPWEIAPTPIPELVEAVGDKSQELLTLADGTKAPAEMVAKVAMEKATAKSKIMADWIEDQFVQGAVYAEMRMVIATSARLGTGVLKGPFPIARKARKWEQQQGVTVLMVAEETAPTSKSIDPRDCFPDPACGENIHNGSYFVQRDYCTKRQLKQLAQLDGYDRAAIAAALREGPASRNRDADRFRDTPGETQSDSDIFELFYYYGDIEPEALLAMGVDQDSIREEDLLLASVPSIVTMLNGKPIKVAINPLDSGEFPFDFFPWEPQEGQPWGRGIPRKMAVPQRMLVAAVRRMLENAGFSSGPQVVFMKGALQPLNGRYEISSPKLWEFTPNEFCDDANKSMKVFLIPSVQKELAEIIAFAQQQADEMTNLPMLMQGQQGTAPELVGGMKMLMANATAPLRVIAKQYDDRLIVPHLRRYYDWGMQSGPEEGKGDLQIKARGSSALLQRELAREFLMQAYQIATRPGSRINPDKLDTELLRSNGVDMATISYTDAEWESMQEAKKNQPHPQDPRIEAANIRAKSLEAESQMETQREMQRMAFEAEESIADRAVNKYINELKFQMQALETANAQNISLEQLKAMLATKAIDSRDKRELFAAERALKMDPANPTDQGI